MLGLGVGFYKIAGNEYPIGGFLPDQIANLALWLPYNTGITSDQDNTVDSPVSHDHSTAAGNMADEDRINAWNDASGNAVHAEQDTYADKPLWETDAADIGGCNFTGTKFFDLARTITIPANTDFTMIMRLKSTLASLPHGLLGSTDDQEFLRIHTTSKFRLKVNNQNHNFTSPSGTLANDTYYTIILTRSNGSTGTFNFYIKGGSYTTDTGVEWTGGGARPDGPITIVNVGCQDDDSNPFRGVLKDVLIYNGTAVTSDERKQLFDYIEGQTNPY